MAHLKENELVTIEYQEINFEKDDFIKKDYGDLKENALELEEYFSKC